MKLDLIAYSFLLVWASDVDSNFKYLGIAFFTFATILSLYSTHGKSLPKIKSLVKKKNDRWVPSNVAFIAGIASAIYIIWKSSILPPDNKLQIPLIMASAALLLNSSAHILLVSLKKQSKSHQ